MMEERRQFVRLSTQLHASYRVIELLNQPKRLALTRNVGGAGISLFTDVSLAAGTVLEVDVMFPSRRSLIHFTGEVMWSGPLVLEGANDPPRAFETGVRFLDIAPKDRAFIVQYATMPTSKPA